MTKKEGLEVSIAVAEAVKLADVDVVAAYPITPQTHIVEHLATLVANGDLNASYIPVESEHSAMSACIGASAVGARTFTATASQGLLYMYESLFIASAMRLPIVMVVANRAISAPISIWPDHTDAMAVRDVGWIQIFAENGQEAVDNVICAFRIGEHNRILLPVMIHMDGFSITHMVEPISMPEKNEVRKLLPSFQPPWPLDPEKPITMGSIGFPFIYTEAKYAQDMNLRSAKKVILQCWREFSLIFGRHYAPVERYRTRDANILLLTMGSLSEAAMVAIDKMRESGERIGLIRLRLWRPFPIDELRQAVKGAEILIVIDRAISFGAAGNPVFSEINAALSQRIPNLKIVSFVGALGGRDISTEGFKQIIREAKRITNKGSKKVYEIYGVRK